MENTAKKSAPMSAGLTTPLSTKEWMLAMLIQMIPVVGIVMMFVWAFGDNVNLNKRNWSRAALLFAAIIMGVGILISIVIGLMAFAFVGSVATSNDFDFSSDFDSEFSDADLAGFLEDIEGLEGFGDIDFATE